MNEHKNSKDPLSPFINQELIEKAPAGFTSKVMTMIQVEPRRAQRSPAKRERSLVPFISAGVIILLIFSTFLLPEGSDLIKFSIADIIQELGLTLPSFDFSKLNIISLPGWIPYMIAGILILSVFDRALYGLFHRREK
jgi:hypothetical protein